MIRTASCLAALAALAIPAIAETRSYDAEAFTGIEARGPIDVVYEQAAKPSITVEQAEGDFSDLFIDFEDGTLIVSRNSIRNRAGWFGNLTINTKNDRKIVKVNGKTVPYYMVRVAGPELSSARASVSAKLVASGIQTRRFDGRATSSGELELTGTALEAKLHASSSGDLLAGGLDADRLDIHASSSGDVDATSTGSGQVTIDASSSGDVALQSLAEAEFVVEASSSAVVSLKGACSSIEIDASSSADIKARELTCHSALVSASSGADVRVYATQSVHANASSGGDVHVDGAPAIRDVSKSSGGDVDFES